MVPWTFLVMCILATLMRYYSMRIPPLFQDNKNDKHPKLGNETHHPVGNEEDDISSTNSSAHSGSSSIIFHQDKQHSSEDDPIIPRKEHNNVTSTNYLTLQAGKNDTSSFENHHNSQQKEEPHPVRIYSSPIIADYDYDYEYETIELSISSSSSSSSDAYYSLGDVAPEFLSTTLDWWPLGTKAWGNASVINANLAHPNLVAAAKGLSPFFLRIGGSQADSILYHIPQQQQQGNNNNNNSRMMTDTPCKRHPQQCLTKERWDEVLDFANRSGARIVFTIAYVRHTQDEHKNNDQRDWDSSNARQFLEYTANSPNSKVVYGFELGNELRHKGKVKNVTRIANAYKELGRIVDQIWSRTEERQQHKPKIVGPASTGTDETSKLLKAVGPYIQIATYHKYHGGGKDSHLRPSYYHPVHLAGPGDAVTKYMTKGDSSELWIGEGAMAYNSGRQNVTDVFHGSLWFANLLGSLAKTKPLAHRVYCRQALLGGYYELISHETLIPNPDYWLAYTWKQLVGSKAIGPIQSPNRKDSLKLSSLFTFGCCDKPGRDSILIHSFCGKSPGDVVFVVINVSSSSAFLLNVTMMGEKRTEYLLTPNEHGLKSREMLLNGKLMSIENGILPDIEELGILRKRDEQFHIPPISIAFLVVHGSEVKECLL